MPAKKKTDRYGELLANNRAWVKERVASDPRFFHKLAQRQEPPFVFIGCSDSRKPINVITQSEPGELFIHRNVANQVSLTDMNCLSMLEFAVDSLGVQHVIVCGHHRCGGVVAALRGTASGIVEDWIAPLRDLALQHRAELGKLRTVEAKADRLAELNVIAQVKNVCKTSVMHAAFRRKDYPQVHAWVFEMRTGHIRELSLPLAAWRREGLLPAGYPLHRRAGRSARPTAL